MEYGRKLRKLRRINDKTLKDVANHLDISITYVSDVERGKRCPFDAFRTEMVCVFLGCTIEDTEELLILCAQERGGFKLTAGVSPLHDRVAAALKLERTNLEDEEVEQILKVVNNV